MEDLTQFLAFEVKKEMADRYFGFRKQIEDDTTAYHSKLAAVSKELENTIGQDLTRIYILLQKEELIKKFLALVNLPENFFYDPYTISSPTIRRRIFAGLGCRGLTRRSRFTRFFHETYRILSAHVFEYIQKLKELEDEQREIEQQIRLFYRKNDIDSMLGFIRQIDGPDASTIGLMQGGPEFFANQQLSNSLRIKPPAAPDGQIPVLAPLPDSVTISAQIENLIDEAYHVPRSWRLRDITSKNS